MTTEDTNGQKDNWPNYDTTGPEVMLECIDISSIGASLNLREDSFSAHITPAAMLAIVPSPKATTLGQTVRGRVQDVVFRMIATLESLKPGDDVEETRLVRWVMRFWEGPGKSRDLEMAMMLLHNKDKNKPAAFLMLESETGEMSKKCGPE